MMNMKGLMPCIFQRNVLRSFEKIFYSRITHARASFSSRSPAPKNGFGICFDIDGVLARGYTPLPEAVRAFQRLKGNSKFIQIPTVFVTNAVTPNSYKAGQLSEWLNCKISVDQMVQAHGPLMMYTGYQDKHCLVVGQGDLRKLAREVGFTNICTIEDISRGYPTLDIGDHEKRSKVATGNIIEKGHRRVETVLLLGEPKNWETSLQLVVDLLLTDGLPNQDASRHDAQTIPIIACSMDLRYKHRSSFERFGHGAFLLCLEQLFEKTTGNKLKYDALIGKPSEITFRFAEHCLSGVASKLGQPEPILRMYMIGDNKEVDIVGSNLYQRFLSGSSFSAARKLPHVSSSLKPSTVQTIHGILVRTGVYQEQTKSSAFQGHRDFPIDEELLTPYCICDNVEDAVDHILHLEKQM